MQRVRRSAVQLAADNSRLSSVCESDWSTCQCNTSRHEQSDELDSTFDFDFDQFKSTSYFSFADNEKLRSQPFAAKKGEATRELDKRVRFQGATTVINKNKIGRLTGFLRSKLLNSERANRHDTLSISNSLSSCRTEESHASRASSFLRNLQKRFVPDKTTPAAGRLRSMANERHAELNRTRLANNPSCADVQDWFVSQQRKYKAALHYLAACRGQLQLSVYKNSGLLTIHVLRAKDIRPRRVGVACNSFVRVSFLPQDDNRRRTCRTETRFDDNDPNYDAKFSFELLNEDLNKRLLISVCHETTAHQNGPTVTELLGCMSFRVRRLCDTTKPVNGWYFLLNEEVGRVKHLEAYDSDWRKDKQRKSLTKSTHSENQHKRTGCEHDKEKYRDARKRDGNQRGRVKETMIAKETTELTTTTTTSTSSLVITKKTVHSCDDAEKSIRTNAKETIDSYLLTHVLKELTVRRSSVGYGFTISGTNPMKVSRVERDSPAFASGLKAGDLLVSINGESVWNCADAGEKAIAITQQSKLLHLVVLSKRTKAQENHYERTLPQAHYRPHSLHVRPEQERNGPVGSPTSVSSVYSAPANARDRSVNSPLERSYLSALCTYADGMTDAAPQTYRTNATAAPFTPHANTKLMVQSTSLQFVARPPFSMHNSCSCPSCASASCSCSCSCTSLCNSNALLEHSHDDEVPSTLPYSAV